ncbi:MAG: hypothetical protein IIC67_10130 [Thaumarchaeota archaeon]|nr:hypothetical protein [Nitrososphaerota archaeon]
MRLLSVGIPLFVIGLMIRIIFDIPCTNCMDLEWYTLPPIGQGGELYVLGFTSTGTLITGIILTLAGLFGSKRIRW